MASERTIVEVEGRRLVLSNLDKVLYPEAGFTKGQVIDYYRRIAPAMLPHLTDRPLTLKRYPGGVNEEFFYEKQCPTHKPDWLPTATIYSESRGRAVNYCLVDSLPALMWVANLASIEMHTLLSRRQDVHRPTMMVFDLDPGPPAGLRQCAEVALRLREMLGSLDLESFIKTSGGKGLHVIVPLNTDVTFDDTKAFANALAKLLAGEMPDEVTANMRKEMRAGRIFVDWSQNDFHKTTVCAYSLRARKLPAVSTPVSWDEIEAFIKSGDESRLIFQALDVLGRVQKEGDLFEKTLTLEQRLPAQVPG